MAEQEEVAPSVEDEGRETGTYKPPKEVPLEQLINQDSEDESLRKYKESLLGGAQPGCVVFPEDPRKVILHKLVLMAEGRPEMELDLTTDLEKLKKQTFVIKEGCIYRIRIDFYVQRDLVSGLKYVQSSHRHGLKVDKDTHMVGSYGPKTEVQSYTTPPEETPSGMMYRGVYKITSLFTDDDDNKHLKWEWKLEIKKDWE